VFSIQHHADQHVEELRAFWGGLLEVAPGSIRAQRESNSNQMTGLIWRSRYGVFGVWLFDTRFRARLESWIDRLRAAWQ